MDKCKNCGKSNFGTIQTSDAFFISETNPKIPNKTWREIKYFCKSCHHAYNENGKLVFTPSS